MTDIVPEGAKFIEGTYSNPAGSRTYKLFVPTGYQGQPLPLIVMLHGCTQSPDDFAAGTRMNFIAEERNCLVVYPAQRSDANPSKCWNWFRSADQQRGAGEPSLIAGITRQVMQDYSVDPSASMSPAFRREGPLRPSWEQRIAICTLRSESIPASPTAPPLTCLPHSPPCGKGRPGRERPGRADWSQLLFSTATATARCILTMAIRPSNKPSARPGRRRRYIAGKYLEDTTTPVRPMPSGEREILEHWNIHGAGHAWSGGSPAGSYTDPQGPDATREMLRFFLGHWLP